MIPMTSKPFFAGKLLSIITLYFTTGKLTLLLTLLDIYPFVPTGSTHLPTYFEKEDKGLFSMLFYPLVKSKHLGCHTYKSLCINNK